ncbi:MAG TPA: hypothetical protein VFS11_09695 [Gemmatimonadales bacterium]|nr:hypothetical protein [Gemmatimonadales bacterium]
MTVARVALVLLLALGLAAFTYLVLERTGRRGWLPLLCRAVAWAALGLLILNLGCPATGPRQRPLVLLDASLSLGGPGGHWRAARDSAARWGDVRDFGDERTSRDSIPTRGRSVLGPALTAASAAARPIIVVTDGEIEDAADLPSDLVARAGVRLFPRTPTPDVAVTAVSGPARVTLGDTLALEADIEAVGGAAPDSVVVAVENGASRVARKVVRVGPARAARARLVFSSTALGPGDHLLRVGLVDQRDAEPRTDTRLHLVTVVPTPGVVLLAGPTDWDSRFLYRALRDVAQLPVRGYARLDQDRWRSMQDLSLVPGAQVRTAARHADLLILKGDVASLGAGSAARGVWSWPSGETGGAPVPGDWYLAATGASPVAGAFAGAPVDSFPPAIQLQPARVGEGDWVALTAQDGRRGPHQPAVVGRDDGKVRRVTVLADGLWRWAFRGGSSEQAYRAWVSATASWLLAGADTARGVARPVRAVVPSGRPVLFEWIGAGVPRAVGVQWTPIGRGDTSGTAIAANDPVEAPPVGNASPAGEAPPAGKIPPAADTLRFDGAGRAQAWLPVGSYRYRLAGGGQGTVAVEAYSDELLPHPVTLGAHEPQPVASGARRSARDWLWLFGLGLLGLVGEWAARRRLGLR